MRGIKQGKITVALPSAAVVALFVAWTGMISSSEWWVTLVALAFVLLILPFFVMLFDRAVKRRRPRRILSIVLGAAAVWVGLSAVDGGCRFVTEIMGLRSGKSIVAAVLLATAAYMSGLENRAIEKLSLVSMTFILISSASLLALALCSDGGVEGLGELALDVFDWDRVKDTFLGLFLPALTAVGWLSVRGERKKEGESLVGALIGTAVGGAVIALCIATVALTVGLPYAAFLRYPYPSAVGSMSSGRLFMRPEWAVWLGYLSAVFTVLSVCISLISRAMGKGRSRVTPFLVSAALWVTCLFVR